MIRAWQLALEQARVINQPQTTSQPNIPANLPPYLQEVISNSKIIFILFF